MTAPMVDYKIHWLKMMSVPESRAVVGRHDGINGRDRFRNRRELASWVGVTPTPWASGDTQRDQGISRDGPAWIRAQLIQMAWRWLRYQPDSALSKWFNERTAGSRGRIRRVMIVGARPQAAHRALAVLRDRPRADWRHARLITRPRCSRPAGRGRGWAGWRVAEPLTG